MKKLKLFSKTYIFTMALISMIIIISHILIYLGLPKVYISNKEKESDNIIEDLIKEINKVDADIEKSFKLAKNFSEKYNIKISLTLNEEKKTFQGYEDVDIYLDQNSVSDETIVLPDIKSDSIIKDYEEGSTGSKSEEDFNQYININNSSIIKSKSFKTINDINGNIQMAMDLESFTETRDVILKILPYSILVSLFIALIASYIYSKKITTPIKEICDVTKEMENLNKRAFCKVETEDEIGILAYNIFSIIIFILISGVLSSCDALLKKSTLIFSDSLTFFISSSNDTIVFNKFSYKLFTLAANIPISSSVFTSQKASLFKFSIFFVTSQISFIGVVIFLAYIYDAISAVNKLIKIEYGSIFNIISLVSVNDSKSITILALPFTSLLFLKSLLFIIDKLFILIY